MKFKSANRIFSHGEIYIAEMNVSGLCPLSNLVPNPVVTPIWQGLWRPWWGSFPSFRLFPALLRPLERAVCPACFLQS